MANRSSQMKRTFSFLVIIFTMASLFAQSPFAISIEPLEISSVGGLQSYALGGSEGKWLIIGGRLDGLHRRQPWASFDLAGHNDQLIVIDPISELSWSASINDLPVSMQEQLRSTNMQFHQDEDMLYITGGYGYSEEVGDHTTFPFLTAVDVPAVIDAVINESTLAPHFRQIEDEQLAVTGGALKQLAGTYYLVGGHRFEGRYNPMDGPSFTQEYTDAVRRFELLDNGVDMSIVWATEWSDAENLHRRDFNVIAQVMPDGSEGLTAFSGVFQPDADIPFLDCVNIDADGYEVQADFSQYYNHYHCANIPIYSTSENEMHTLFFGGIAQYYEDDGELVMDDEVPFVKTIARITRTADGTMTEYKLPIEMPDYLGSGAEFIKLDDIATVSNDIIDLNALTGDSILIGHIFGGIASTDRNIFWINDGTQSAASNSFLKVYLHPGQTTNLDFLNNQSQGGMRMQLYPNAQTGTLYIDLILDTPEDIEVLLYDLSGKLIARQAFRKGKLNSGKNELVMKARAMELGQAYVVQVICGTNTIAQKMMVNE